MPSLIRAAAAAALLLAWLAGWDASPALARPPQAPAATTTADPALWVVKDRDTTVYLFGTIHVLKPGVRWFGGQVKRAFDASDTLVTEVIDPRDPAVARLMLTLAQAPEGPPLTDTLSPRGRTDYLAALKALDLPPAAFDRYKPWAAALFVQVVQLQKLGYGPQAGAEAGLESAAGQAGKAREALETAEAQLRLMDSLPRPTQIAFLEATVKSLADNETGLNQMVSAWSRGDPDGLARLLNEAFDGSPELHRLLLADRNAHWADWIAERMKRPGTVFVAVGAGHLAGKDSVQQYLEAKRLKAVRLRPGRR